MTFFQKLKKISSNLFKYQNSVTVEKAALDINSRMDRMERNYIVLLKRVLEMDGVQIPSRTNAFSSKVLRTPSDEFTNGFNESEPTIH